MLGISGGFIYGVGFVPRFWLWKWLFSPVIAWPLMLLGYYIWLLQ
ncbi:cyd operon YbgE family protein, partial [Gordonia sp. OPL2]